MSASLETQPAPVGEPTVEQTIVASLKSLRLNVEDRLRVSEQTIRREPLKAVLCAFAAGYVIRILPLGGILRLLAGLGLAGVRPLALFYGAAKVKELLQRSSRR